VVWTYAGVRPLLDDASGDPSAVTRDYLLEPNREGAPLLSVWGGKITTFRKLAEDAATEVGQMLGEARRPWTEGLPARRRPARLDRPGPPPGHRLRAPGADPGPAPPLAAGPAGAAWRGPTGPGWAR
jgi:glycerol-3-phosphate dehydrogenase